MLTTDQTNHGILQQSVLRHRQIINDEVLRLARATLAYYDDPTPVKEYMARIEDLWRILHTVAPRDVPDHLLPYLKTAFLVERLLEANKIDQQKVLLTSAEMIARLDERLIPYEKIAKQPWFQCNAARPPRLTDILTLEKAEEFFLAGMVLSARKYDEKFHVLQSPDLFLPDLYFQRRQCDLRDAALCVAFLDIDNFKVTFNKPYGETHVDRYVLLPFMSALEGHVYAHGTAYRFGGDEYAVIYPNVDRRLGARLLYRFIDMLAEMSYVGVRDKVTVTIGLAEIRSNCPLTNREILQRAEQAKNYGKERQKGLIVGYLDEMMENPEYLHRES